MVPEVRVSIDARILHSLYSIVSSAWSSNLEYSETRSTLASSEIRMLFVYLVEYWEFS